MPCNIVGGVCVCSRSAKQDPRAKAGPGYVTGICRLATEKGLNDDALMKLVRNATGRAWDPDHMNCGQAWDILRALKKLGDPKQPGLFEETV